ncbi:MAG TPA: ABC transporter ATP-binding protein [Candidatus Competibacter sp.]|nr:ABC transporter ATP-binding protein [Candidatus Competibacter sp.]
MIDIRQLLVTFNPNTPLETPVLRGVSLQIPAGQFMTVIGSNGAGKSTLLNALAGEIAVTDGTIAIDGQDVTGWSVARRAQWVARVFQDPLAGTCAELTVEENLALAAARGQRRGLRPAIRSELRGEFRDQLARLGLNLEHRLPDRMNLLSGGQRQAVSLLMATLRPMKILLLDEHTAALDPRTAAFVLDLTRALVAERRLTTLMVTHNLRQALDIGDRTVMLHQGRVVFDISGTERTQLDVPDLLRLFSESQGGAVTDDELLLG